MTEPVGQGKNGDVWLGDIWPSNAEVQALMSKAMDPAVFRSNYAQIKSDPGALWEKIAGVQGEVYNWPTSTYIARSEEHTSELQSLMRISYAVFCLKKKKK